jgi:predicted O-methyltransferase YrrM
VLDDRVRAVLARLEEEDRRERDEGVARESRARSVARTTGQFLFGLVAPQTDCEVLEVGGSRGYSTIWLAAGVRYLGGRVLSLEHDPARARQGDPALESVTIPLDRGLELSVVLGSL